MIMDCAAGEGYDVVYPSEIASTRVTIRQLFQAEMAIMTGAIWDDVNEQEQPFVPPVGSRITNGRQRR